MTVSRKDIRNKNHKNILKPLADFIISAHDIYARRQVLNILKLFNSCGRFFLHGCYRYFHYTHYGVAPGIFIVPQAVGAFSALFLINLSSNVKNENNKVRWLIHCHP